MREIQGALRSMTMTQDRVYTYVQELFRKGTVIIVGSGASCAYGLPSMTKLAEHLLKAVPERIQAKDGPAWQEWLRIAEALNLGLGLETAIGDSAVLDTLAEALTTEISSLVRASEARAIADILVSDHHSAFGRLFEHILRSAEHSDVITTNYDRLLEVHAARVGVRVDSMYYGHTIGRLDAALSREELFEARSAPGRGSRSVSVRSRSHIRLSKPHGSLDWFAHRDEYFRSDLAIPGSEQIIAPGGNKYRLGYEVPFEQHRNRANDAIDGATSLFCIGYGFNDEHLQTHLRSKFAQVPSVVVSHSLTENALAYLASNLNAIGIEAADDGQGSRIVQGEDSFELDLPLWDLEHLVKEVLGI